MSCLAPVTNPALYTRAGYPGSSGVPNVGNAIYFHQYAPTRFTWPDTPWWNQANSPPFARLPPNVGVPGGMLWPPGTSHGSPQFGLPYNPLLGRFGTAEVSLKGYNTENNCQFGYYPANINGAGACCNVYGQCGSGDTPLN